MTYDPPGFEPDVDPDHWSGDGREPSTFDPAPVPPRRGRYVPAVLDALGVEDSRNALNGRRFLILGAGGTARTIAWGLLRRDANVGVMRADEFLTSLAVSSRHASGPANRVRAGRV